MKKITLIIFMLCVSTIVFAQESRKISDLMYFPMQGQFFLSSFYSFSKSTYSDYTPWAKNKDYKQQISDIDTLIAIGLLNNLYISISEEYKLNNKITEKPLWGESETSKSKGFADPYFNIGLRILEQPNYPFTIDFHTSYSPKVIDAKLASSEKNGNNGRGGYEISTEFEVGKKFNSFQIAMNLSYSYFGERKVEDLANYYDNTIKITGGNIIEASLEFQNNIFNELYLRYGLVYLYMTEEKYQEGYDTQKNDPINTYGLNVGLSYTFIPEKINASFTYGYLKAKDYTTTINTYNTLKTKDLQIHVFQLGINIQI